MNTLWSKPIKSKLWFYFYGRSPAVNLHLGLLTGFPVGLCWIFLYLSSDQHFPASLPSLNKSFPTLWCCDQQVSQQEWHDPPWLLATRASGFLSTTDIHSSELWLFKSYNDAPCLLPWSKPVLCGSALWVQAFRHPSLAATRYPRMTKACMDESKQNSRHAFDEWMTS